MLTDEQKAAWLAFWESRLSDPDLHADDEDVADQLRHDIEDNARLLTAPADIWIRDGGLQCRTIGMVACCFGVSDRTIQFWLSRGCPGKPGAYDLPRILTWAKRNVRIREGYE